MSVSAIEVISHPTTTIASGFWSSAPTPVLQIIGRSHKTEVNAVISTGLNLIMAPCITEKWIHSLVIMAFL